jgi:hypothetical protein
MSDVLSFAWSIDQVDCAGRSNVCKEINLLFNFIHFTAASSPAFTFSTFIVAVVRILMGKVFSALVTFTMFTETSSFGVSFDSFYEARVLMCRDLIRKRGRRARASKSQ